MISGGEGLTLRGPSVRRVLGLSCFSLFYDVSFVFHWLFPSVMLRFLYHFVSCVFCGYRGARIQHAVVVGSAFKPITLLAARDLVHRCPFARSRTLITSLSVLFPLSCSQNSLNLTF